MEEVCRNLKTISTALNDLSVLLGGLELGQGESPSLFLRDEGSAQRTSGYVNWKSSHDILKTERWMKVSIITDYCTRIKLGFQPNLIEENHVVNEETRFPKDNLYVNVQSAIVRAELLYIEYQGKSATGLVDRFLDKVKDEMHTLSSFEKKYGLKWVEPISKESIVVNTEPIQEAVHVPRLDNETTVKPVISDSWCLSEDPDVKEEIFISKEEDLATREIRKKFKDILDKLIPRNFDDLLAKVRKLEINNQKTMEVVVDLLFEKALEMPIYSEVYATLAHKLSTLKVPSDNNPELCVNFRGLFINKCQEYFENGMKNELVETNEPTTEKELQMKINEKNMITKKRVVAHIKFIGELYKLEILTSKIIDYYLRNLCKELDEHKLECLCEFLSTAGKKIAQKMGKNNLDLIFKKMQAYVDLNPNKISHRVKSMFLEIVELRDKGWVVDAPVVKALPKTMDEIQEESEKRALLIELMKAFDVGASTSDSIGGVIQRKEDGRSKHAITNLYSIDALKLEAVKQGTQNYIQFPPESFKKVNDDILEKLQAVPASRGDMLENQDVLPTYKVNNAIVERSNPKLIKINVPSAPKVPINESQIRKLVRNSVSEFLVHEINEVVVSEVKLLPSQYHATVVDEILKAVIEKTMNEVETVARLLLHLVETNAISPESFVAGLEETFTHAPDILIDVPMLYDHLGKILAPHIKNDHITLNNILELSATIINENQGDRLLTSIIDCLCEDMGNDFVRSKWQESGMNVQKLSEWMREEQVSEWIYDNDYEFLHYV